MLQRVYRSLAVFCLIAVSIFVSVPGRTAPDAGSFIQSLGNETIGIIQNKSMSLQDRKTAFGLLFKRDLDLHIISQQALGQYWSTATPAQQEEFVSVFGDYLISIYANKFSNYNGVRFKISGEQPQSAGTTGVLSEIDPPDGQAPIQVDWIVADENGTFKIIDVQASNLSMGKMHRDEYASVIKNNGGRVQVLIDMLKEKMKED